MKPFWQSKTFWLNVISGAAALLAVASDQQLFGIDPEFYVMALALLNIGLRFVTSEPVTIR